MLLLGVHAVEGAAAPGGGAGRGPLGAEAAPAVTGEVDVDATLRSRDAFSSHWDDRHQIDWVETLDNRGATTAKGDPREIPDRLLVLGGGVVLTFADGTELVADELLVATGRRPRTGDLGLDTVGLEPGRSIETDDQLRAIGVDGGWLYAVGDVNGRALLTHHGKYQARLVGDHLAGKDVEARADHQAVVRVIFTDPQVAAVGLTEAGAREQELDVKTLSYGIGGTSPAGTARQGRLRHGPPRGRHRGPHRPRRDVHRPGRGRDAPRRDHRDRVGITVDQLWHAVPAFPTVSEVWLRLLETDRGTA